MGYWRERGYRARHNALEMSCGGAAEASAWAPERAHAKSSMPTTALT